MIGVYAPYDLSDTCAMAISLVRLGASAGHDIDYYCHGDKTLNVCEVLDKKVKSIKDTVITDWLDKCSHVVWFVAPYDLLKISVSSAKKNTLVLTSYSTTPDMGTLAQVFDAIIMPATGIHQQLCHNTAWVAEQTVPLIWDPGTVFTGKHGAIDNNNLRLYVPIQPIGAEKFGHTIFAALDILADMLPNLKITVGQRKRWNAATSRLYEDLKQRIGMRLTTCTPDYDSRSALYKSHDWTLYLATEDDVQYPVIESISCGTPVLAYDTMAIKHIIGDNLFGKLLPCALYKDKIWDAPIGVNANLKQLVDGLKSALANPFGLPLFNRGNSLAAHLEVRRKCFKDVWLEVLAQ